MFKIRKDRTNQRIGKLVALRFSKVDKYGRALWLYQCDCGNQKEINPGDLLRNGKLKIKSCGCVKTFLPENEAILRRKFSSYKDKCKIKKIKFEINYEQFSNIVKKECFYCKLEANPFNGIDRVDNNLRI